MPVRYGPGDVVSKAKFIAAARKAVATFLFASLGLLIGAPLLDIDTETWKLALSTGLGALINLIYRWAEKAQSTPNEGA